MAEPTGHVLGDRGNCLVVKIPEGSVARELLQVQLFAVPVGLLSWKELRGRLSDRD